MREIGELIRRVSDLEHRVSRQIRYGTVQEVRHRDGQIEVRARIGLDTEGNHLLSPWVPWAQTAGALKVHTPPTSGQQVRLMAPDGEARQAVAEPFTWSDDNPTPSDQLDRNVLTFGGWRIEWKEGGIEVGKGGTKLTIAEGSFKFEADGVTHEITSDGLKTTGGRIEHDGKNIGKDHRHRDVEPGPALTGVPTE